MTTKRQHRLSHCPNGCDASTIAYDLSGVPGWICEGCGFNAEPEPAYEEKVAALAEHGAALPTYIEPNVRRSIALTDPDMAEWHSLDGEARANLSGPALAEFFRYRDRLRESGCRWSGDAYETLVGYIWGQLEEVPDGDAEAGRVIAEAEWFIFGEHPDGAVDIACCEGDVLRAVPRELAEQIIKLREATLASTAARPSAVRSDKPLDGVKGFRRL